MAEGGKGDGPVAKPKKCSGKGVSSGYTGRNKKGKEKLPNWKMRFLKRISKTFTTEKSLPSSSIPPQNEVDLDGDLNKMTKPWTPTEIDAYWEEDSPLTPRRRNKEEDEEEDSSEWEDDEYTDQRNSSVSASYIYHFDPEEESSYKKEEEEEEVENDEKFFVPELNLASFKVTPEQITSSSGRSHTKKQTLLGSRRLRKEFRRPRGSYLRCPEGGEYRPEKFGKRINPGPFLTCPIPHEQGGLYRPFRMRHKINRGEMPSYRRPWYLRVRQPRLFQKAPFFKKVEVPL
jgi:hypothetical protein